jgi:hypothetical protein
MLLPLYNLLAKLYGIGKTKWYLNTIAFLSCHC